jgi:hypothetical protein
LDELSKHAHSFGEVVGLGLRELAHCPVEMNLMPKSSLQRQEMARKNPYFIASGLGLILIVFALGYTQQRIAGIHRAAKDTLNQSILPRQKIEKELSAATTERDTLKKQLDDLASQIQFRYYWPDILSKLRVAMLNAETKTRESLKTRDNVDVELGIWLEAFSPLIPSDVKYTIQGQQYSGATIQSGLATAIAALKTTNASQANADAASTTSTEATGQISQIGMVFRGIDREKAAPSANADLAYNVKEELKASGLFAEPIVLGDIQKTDSNGTFVFQALLTLKSPLKL